MQLKLHKDTISYQIQIWHHTLVCRGDLFQVNLKDKNLTILSTMPSKDQKKPKLFSVIILLNSTSILFIKNGHRYVAAWCTVYACNYSSITAKQAFQHKRYSQNKYIPKFEME